MRETPVELARRDSPLAPDARIHGTGSFGWMMVLPATNDNVELLAQELEFNSATGTRTWVARVRAEYPNQLDYSGDVEPREGVTLFG